MAQIQLHQASFPAHLSVVQVLFREYAATLGIDLSFQDFDREVTTLPGKYAPPAGGLWIAFDGVAAAGCIALRPLMQKTCEMKRLYVRPAYRGSGVGRKLVEHVLAAAVEKGYRRISLDTLSTMAAAIELYRSLGFEEVSAYCHNPVQGAKFFAKELR